MKRILATAGLSALIVLPFTSYAATQIGTGSVSGTGAFNSAIMWDGALPGTASGTVSGITVTANVTPTLNMALSASSLSLGTLNSSTYSTGTLALEIGTNAVSGVSVTVKSNSGGLTNTSTGTTQINNSLTDGIAESYKFTSALSGALDSTVVGYTRTSSLSTEISTNASNTIYTTNKPEQTTGVDDVRFDVSAKISAETPAGNYADNLSFTVSGNF